MLLTLAAAQVLDRIEILDTRRGQAEIHIVFNTRAIYLSHSPPKRGDRLEVFLQFPELPPTQRLSRQQQAASPRSPGMPKLTVVFPAQQTNRTSSLVIQFSQPVEYTVSVRNVQRSSVVVVSIPLRPKPDTAKSPAVSPAPRQSPLTLPERKPGETVEAYAERLMQHAKAALQAEQYEHAIVLFNALLNLPPNRYTQEAQELVGMARERSGEIAKAKIEYELYLKLYPEGEGAARVRERLAALDKVKPVPRARRKKKRPPKERREFSVFGTLTQFYFGGFSQQKTTQDNNGVQTTTTTSTQDQSLLLTTADVTGRYRFNEYDTKIVLRGSYGQDFLDTRDQKDPRLRALYIEHGDNERYGIRIGRQPGNAGGILDLRFDGGWFRYKVAPYCSLNFVAGKPRPFLLQTGRSPDDPREFQFSTDRHLAGINLDFGPVQDAFSGNIYFLNQVVRGLTDRRAIGVELRYVDEQRTGFLLLDYDVHFGVLNIANFNGTWISPLGTTFNLLVDHRKSPFVQTTNALLANGPNSIEASLSGFSEAELNALAAALSGDSDLYLLGVTHPITARWQLGGDVRLNRVSGVSTIQPSTDDTGAPILSSALLQLPDTGNVWTFTLQALGMEFLWKSHTIVFNASIVHSKDFDGQTLGVSSLARFENRWQVDTLFTVFRQQNATGIDQYRIAPSVRVDYRWSPSVALEGLFGLEQTFSNGPTIDDSLLREFFFLGIRWER